MDPPLFETGNPHSILKYLIHAIFMGRFAIDPNDGFRPTESDQQPSAVFHDELESVDGDDFGDAKPSDSFWSGAGYVVTNFSSPTLVKLVVDPFATK